MTLDDYAALSRKRRAAMGLPSWGEPPKPYEAKVGIDYAYESDCPAWKCPHISVHDWREGRRCPEHSCTCEDHVNGSGA